VAGEASGNIDTEALERQFRAAEAARLLVNADCARTALVVQARLFRCQKSSIGALASCIRGDANVCVWCALTTHRDSPRFDVCNSPAEPADVKLASQSLPELVVAYQTALRMQRESLEATVNAKAPEQARKSASSIVALEPEALRIQHEKQDCTAHPSHKKASSKGNAQEGSSDEEASGAEDSSAGAHPPAQEADHVEANIAYTPWPPNSRHEEELEEMATSLAPEREALLIQHDEPERAALLPQQRSSSKGSAQEGSSDEEVPSEESAVIAAHLPAQDAKRVEVYIADSSWPPSGLLKMAAGVKRRALTLVNTPRFQVTAVSAAGGAVTLGAGGAAVGCVTGSACGAAVGLAGAVFTLGLSIPIGASIGGGVGLCVGGTVGGTVGSVWAGAAGYTIHRYQSSNAEVPCVIQIHTCR